MRSSYKENKYNNVFKSIVFTVNPSLIVEFGILDGYSLESFAESSGIETQIMAYDIFEDFPYNSANFENISKKFEKYKNVSIHRGDFFKADTSFSDGQIDLLHVDIANNGDVFKHTLDKYMDKVSKNGICILEGGSIERDDVVWMEKFNKPKIHPIINEAKIRYDILVLEDYPSITLIKHRGENNETSGR